MVLAIVEQLFKGRAGYEVIDIIILFPVHRSRITVLVKTPGLHWLLLTTFLRAAKMF